MTIEEVRRVFCFVAKTARTNLADFVEKMRHRQDRNRDARLSHWRRTLGRHVAPGRLKGVPTGPVRSAIGKTPG